MGSLPQASIICLRPTILVNEEHCGTALLSSHVMADRMEFPWLSTGIKVPPCAEKHTATTFWELIWGRFIISLMELTVANQMS
jgi:hypothetical protein